MLMCINMGGSESRPMKVELTHMDSKNATTTMSILKVTMKLIYVPTKTSLMAMIFLT